MIPSFRYATPEAHGELRAMVDRGLPTCESDHISFWVVSSTLDCL
jgi:hypothetical protein